MKKRIASFLLAFIMLVTMFPGGMKAEAANYTLLTIPWNYINQCGHQATSGPCQAYCWAYCRIILDNKPHQYTEYWLASSGLAKAASAAGYKVNDRLSSEKEFLKAIYNEINKGRPPVITVKGSGSNLHYVTCIGYRTGCNPNNLSTSDIAILNPANAAITSSAGSKQTYSLLSSCVIMNYGYFSATSGGVSLTDGSTPTPDPTPAAVGKTSTPTVSVNGQSVTVSWTYSGSATGFDVYLIQEPSTWNDVKYRGSVGQSSRSYTFSNVTPGNYYAFVIARPNDDSVQSGWKPLSVAAGKTSTPTVSVNGQTVTVSWTYSGSTTGFDVYLIQEPCTWNDVKYRGSVGQFSRSRTFSNVAPGKYYAFVIARPNADTVQSGWTFVVVDAPHTHKWDSGKVTKEATYVFTGTYTYTCTGCGQTKTETIPLITKADGKCGDNVTWAYDDTTGTLTLSGTGPTYNYTITSSAPWLDSKNTAGRVKKVIISPGITTIGNWLFEGFGHATSVSIPTSVKSIGISAFASWHDIKNVTIPTGTVGNYAFYGSDDGLLETVVLEEGVTEIGELAFAAGPNVKKVYIPKSLTSIGKDAFYWNTVQEVYYGGSPSDWKALNPQSTRGFNPNLVIHYAESDPEGPDETPSTSTSFSDVSPSAYYAEPVAWAVENNITSGTGNGKFSPDQACTRAQAMTFLWKAMGSPMVGNASAFSDVSSSSYYYNAVNWAVANGITSGTGNGKFSPDQKCTRAQIVTFLWKATGSQSSSGSTFSDVSSGAYYKNAVSWAVANGITSGTGNGKFSPDQNCTRGQIVTFLYKTQ